ncbi:hypothetical protein ACFC1R_34795 [Kitasatospora sp. NPDC056138]|uniref:hypothetical protein n=1 Tax=Kitasatospora sp. NPDC056138 TaxID=3345724 RepID=UPI0035DE8C41
MSPRQPVIHDRPPRPNDPRDRARYDRRQAAREGEEEPFRRRHLVFTAHLPDGLVVAVAATEQDNLG